MRWNESIWMVILLQIFTDCSCLAEWVNSSTPAPSSAADRGGFWKYGSVTAHYCESNCFDVFLTYVLIMGVVKFFSSASRVSGAIIGFRCQFLRFRWIIRSAGFQSAMRCCDISAVSQVDYLIKIWWNWMFVGVSMRKTSRLPLAWRICSSVSSLSFPVPSFMELSSVSPAIYIYIYIFMHARIIIDIFQSRRNVVNLHRVSVAFQPPFQLESPSVRWFWRKFFHIY